MKGLKVFLKSLIGIPMGIFTLEILNIVVSLQEGEYIRLDGLANGINLNSIILAYMYCSIYSYIIMVFINYMLEFAEINLPIKERKRQINKVAIPVIILVLAIFFITMSINTSNYENIFGMCSAVLWSFVAIIIGMVQNLLSKHSIKEINQTLKDAFKE